MSIEYRRYRGIRTEPLRHPGRGVKVAVVGDGDVRGCNEADMEGLEF